MSRSARGLAAVLLAGAACGAQAGCYEHVVRTEGYGARADEVYEPNVKEEDTGALDTLFWGEKPENEKTRKR
jgi:hypothetical protein